MAFSSLLMAKAITFHNPLMRKARTLHTSLRGKASTLNSLSMDLASTRFNRFLSVMINTSSHCSVVPISYNNQTLPKAMKPSR